MTAYPSKERRIVRAQQFIQFCNNNKKSKKKLLRKKRIIAACESNTQELLSATSVFVAMEHIQYCTVASSEYHSFK